MNFNKKRCLELLKERKIVLPKNLLTLFLQKFSFRIRIRLKN